MPGTNEEKEGGEDAGCLRKENAELLGVQPHNFFI
jgi:hypothetical protein